MTELEQQRMQELIRRLNEASEAYYGGRDEIMSNFEWDALFDELTRLEAKTGVVLPDSPTQKVNAAAEDNKAGEKETHEFPALSLAKTKKVEDLQEWAGDRPVWLSWKLDGLTLVLTYDGGRLTKILTRGNGSVGTNITFMKEAIKGFPLEVEDRGHLVVRGEATISYPEFEKLNATISDPAERYANPRNLASGTLGLDARRLEEVRQRNVTFNAFTLVHTDEEILSWGGRMDYLDRLGFTTVDRELTDADHLPETVAEWTRRVESGEMQIPVDGLVIAYDDTEYAATGRVYRHHAARAGLAFKWPEEKAITTLRHLDWFCDSMRIIPIAVFDPVKLEGTTVSRASLVNISEMERLGIGENGKTEIEVIKADKIKPKVVGVVKTTGKFEIPERCPACNGVLKVYKGLPGLPSELKCCNTECPAKNYKRYDHFVSSEGTNIVGLSAGVLYRLIGHGFIHSFADVFRLSRHADEIRELEGFSQKRCDNLLAAIEKSRTGTDAVHFLTALSIPQIGGDAAKRLVDAYGWPGFVKALEEEADLASVNGLGPERSACIRTWYADDKNRSVFYELLEILEIAASEPVTEVKGSCAGLTFVITGDVHQFKNRDEFKAYVEANGGKVAGSVSKKTSYLVNNDVTSTSSKNTKARELGIPILSEDDFIAQYGSSYRPPASVNRGFSLINPSKTVEAPQLKVALIDGYGKILATQDYEEYRYGKRKSELLLCTRGRALYNILLDDLDLISINDNRIVIKQILRSNGNSTVVMNLLGKIAEAVLVRRCNEDEELNLNLLKLGSKRRVWLKTANKYEAVGTGLKRTRSRYPYHYSPEDTQRDIIWLDTEGSPAHMSDGNLAGLQVKVSSDGEDYVYPDIISRRYSVPVVYFPIEDDFEALISKILKNQREPVDPTTGEYGGIKLGEDLVDIRKYDHRSFEEVKDYYPLVKDILE